MGSLDTRVVTEVWRKAVAEAEDEVLRVTPTLPGGRKHDETVEHYAERCVAAIKESVDRLHVCREQLAAVRRLKP